MAFWRLGKSGQSEGMGTTSPAQRAGSYPFDGVGMASWPINTFTASGTYQTIPLPTQIEVPRIAVIVTAVSGFTSVVINVNYTPNGGSVTPIFANSPRIDNLALSTVTYFIPDVPNLRFPPDASPITLATLSITHVVTGAGSITFGVSLVILNTDPRLYKTRDGNPGYNGAVAASGASNYLDANAGW